MRRLETIFMCCKRTWIAKILPYRYILTSHHYRSASVGNERLNMHVKDCIAKSLAVLEHIYHRGSRPIAFDHINDT